MLGVIPDLESYSFDNTFNSSLFLWTLGTVRYFKIFLLLCGLETDFFTVEMMLTVLKEVECMVEETPCFPAFLNLAYRSPVYQKP
jgi:hypothetical protein